MRFVDRSAVAAPASLADASEAVKAEVTAASAYYAANDPSLPGFRAYKFEHYRGRDVVRALHSLFKGKCAYCETQISAGSARDVEHYRPKGGIEGEPTHPGYWWLALEWTNLLPACPGCNRGLRQHIVDETMTVEDVEKMMARSPRSTFGKRNFFPIAGVRANGQGDDLVAEQPLLIDPTRHDPYYELRWVWPNSLSVVVPAARQLGGHSSFGRETIRCCSLNRAELVQARSEVLRELQVQRIEILKELDESARDGANFAQHLRRAVQRATAMRRHYEPGRPYAGMAKAFVHLFEEELRDRLPAPAAVPADVPQQASA